jgi:hypothetical protein
MDSAQGVFRFAASHALRWARDACLSSVGMLCLRALRRAFISCLSFDGLFLLAFLLWAFMSCLSLGVRFCLAALWLAFLSSSVLFCLIALRRAFISSLCSGVSLSRRALSRFLLCRFLSHVTLVLETICSVKLDVPWSVLGLSARSMCTLLIQSTRFEVIYYSWFDLQIKIYRSPYSNGERCRMNTYHLLFPNALLTPSLWGFCLLEALCGWMVHIWKYQMLVPS